MPTTNSTYPMITIDLPILYHVLHSYFLLIVYYRSRLRNALFNTYASDACWPPNLHPPNVEAVGEQCRSGSTTWRSARMTASVLIGGVRTAILAYLVPAAKITGPGAYYVHSGCMSALMFRALTCKICVIGMYLRPKSKLTCLAFTPQSIRFIQLLVWKSKITRYAFYMFDFFNWVTPCNVHCEVFHWCLQYTQSSSSNPFQDD